MKTSSLLWIVFLSLALLAPLSMLASDGLPSSIYLERPLRASGQGPATTLDVAVVQGLRAEFQVPEYELERLAADLRATEVFHSVRVGQVDGVEILAVTREVFDGPGCGNPLIPTMMTFGIIPTTLPRTIYYDFELKFVGDETTLPVRNSYSTKEKFGLIAVPLRLSKNWIKSPQSGTPQPFIQALREDLLTLLTSRELHNRSETEELLPSRRDVMI